MAGNRKFHNKFHSANHHTLPSPHIIDSGLDPIASHGFPFIGDFVLNGTVSSSNNYLLNNGGIRAVTLDSVEHGLAVPAGWNVFRDSTYFDGNVTITGNLSALGELTYLHTQVHVTSATEIEVKADNSNGKTVGLLVDQHGSNDVVHIKNDGQSTLLITGSAADDESRGGWMGINLASLSARGIDRPNQRMTVVGSVSVVPDEIEVADQMGQKDPGMSGSLYIEGGLHVNEATYLDQVTIDTTDGKFLVSGNNNDGNANIFEVEVPTHLDRTHIDTTDGVFTVSGDTSMDVDVPSDFSGHADLDSVHIDVTKGNFVVSGTENKMYINTGGGLDVNTFTQLDKTEINTSDGNFNVTGPNTITFNNSGGLDVQHHTRLDQVTIDTTDGVFLVSGSGQPGSENKVDIDVPVEMDRVTIDTTDGNLIITGSNTVLIDSASGVVIDTHTHLDQVTIDTSDGNFVVSGAGIAGSEHPVDIDVPIQLDRVTVDTTDGNFVISGQGTPGQENIVDIDVPVELDRVTIDTTDGDLVITGSSSVLIDSISGVDIDTHTKVDQLTVDTNDGEMLIHGDNILDVNVDASFIDSTVSARNVIIDTIPETGNVLIRGGGRVDVATETYFDNPVEMDRVTIDTTDGQFKITNPSLSFFSRNRMIVDVPLAVQSLTASSDLAPIVITGSNETTFNTDVDFNRPVDLFSSVYSYTNFTANNLTVSADTILGKTEINTTAGSFSVVGTNQSIIQTDVRITRDLLIEGDLRVEGNAYLSAGNGGIINVGDSSNDNVIFRADISSDILPDLTDSYNLGSTDQRWLSLHSVSGSVDYLSVANNFALAGSLDVDGVTTLDETIIDTDSGSFVVSGDNRSHIYTNLSTHDGLSATGGPWRFTNFDEIKYESPGFVNYEGIDNWETGAVLNHPFRVDTRSLFNQGLTAFGPVQIGELPEGVTDELTEPTFEVIGNTHLREGNLKIDSDIRHLGDEDTLIRFSTDKIELRAGGDQMISLTQAPSGTGNNSIEIGSTDAPASVTLYKDLSGEQPGVIYDSETGSLEIHGNVGVFGANESTEIIGDGVDIHGSLRVTETLSARNLIVDYITVQESSFGNIGGQIGGAAEMSTLSGTASAGHVTTEWVNGQTQSFTGTEIGIEFDLENDDQGDIQKLYSFTFEALSADPVRGVQVGDTQSTTYQFAAKWDEYYTQAFVNEVEYGIIHTSSQPFVEVQSVVLSAHDVPTNERIVKIVIQPSADIKFYAHNILVQDKPRRLDTVTTADFDVNGYLTVNGYTSADGDIITTGDLYVSGASVFEQNVHIKGNLRVDGNAFLSAGSDGIINVGDTSGDGVIFNADIHSSFIPDIDKAYNIGAPGVEWKKIFTQDIHSSNIISWLGGDSLLSNSVYGSVNSVSAQWDSVYTDVSNTSAEWDSVYTDVSNTSAEWDSVYTDVSETSAEWDSVYTDVSNTSAQWDSVYTDVSNTSAQWDSVYTDVSNTSAQWNSVYTDVSETSAQWDSVYTDVSNTSAQWNSVYTDVSETSAQWDSVYTDVSNTSAEWDSVYTDVSETSAQWDSVYTDVSETSAEWDSVYSWVNSDSATNNSDYNQTHFVNASGDTIVGSLYITGDLRVDGNAYLSGGTGGVINVGDDTADIVTFNANIGSSLTPDMDNVFDLGTESQSWRNIHTKGIVKWNGGSSVDSNSVYSFVNNTSGDEGYATLSAYKDNRYVLRHDQVPDLAITNVYRVSNSSLVTTLKANIHRGDIVLVNDTEDNLIAVADLPDGGYSSSTGEYYGYEKLFAPGNMVRFINGKQGPSVTFTTDDFDFTDSTNKFVLQGDIDTWNSNHVSVSTTSALWNSVYTDMSTSSGDWNMIQTTVQDYSASWEETADINVVADDLSATKMLLGSVSGDWNMIQTTVQDYSASWEETADINVVADDLSATKMLLGSVSGDWNSVYTDVSNTSAQWDSVYTDVSNTSAEWNSVYTDVSNTSGEWNSVYTDVSNTSAEWDSVYTDVSETSGDWNNVYTDVSNTSAEWNSVYTDVSNTSGEWNSVYTDVSETSGEWNSVYTDVSETSAEWDSVYTDVSDTSGEWNSVYTDVSETSAQWNSVYTDVSETSAEWDSVYTDVSDTSGDWNSVYTDVSNTSAEWDSVYTDVSETSGDWNNVYTDVSNTSAQWDSVYTDVSNTSAEWDSVYTDVSETSGEWNSVYTDVSNTSAQWDSVYTDVSETSAEWDSVYSYINVASGDFGIATLGSDGKLDEALVPNLSISEVYVVTYSSQVSALCDGSLQGPVNIERGDVVIVTTDEHSLIALVDEPTGNYNTGFDTFAGFTKLATATDFIKTINGKQGYNVTINPDDLDDYQTAHKFVSQDQKDKGDSVYTSVNNTSAEWDSVYSSVCATSAEWDSVYSWVNSDSATNNSDYNQTHFVNASGDTITGPLNVIGLTDLKTLSAVEIGVSENVSVSGDVHIKGDLFVDGNAYLSAGDSGDINVGDSADDSVVFNADIRSNITPDTTGTYNLGSSAREWSAMHSVSAFVQRQDIIDLNVTGTATLTGKSDVGPGIIVTGTPTGIFDVNTIGFEDRDGDYMIPDIDITGDVALHGSLSADNVHIYSLTASNFKAEYQRLVINEGDLELLDGNIRQRGGNISIQGDITHIDDENTYIRFEEDRISFVTHDVPMIQLNENATEDDVIIIGDTGSNVDLRVQNILDHNTFFIDSQTAYVGIGTDEPTCKLHVLGEVKFQGGQTNLSDQTSLIIPVGVDGAGVPVNGSIRYNRDLIRYEGYVEFLDSWESLNDLEDSDGDTGVTVRNRDFDGESDWDTVVAYTAGCSAMTIYPDQTVAFAGDIQFDNITVYDSDSVTGPLSATSEFIYLKVNGKDRAIRLWETPADTREDLNTLHGENITEIGDDCGLGLTGNVPVQTISAQNVLTLPPTQ